MVLHPSGRELVLLLDALVRDDPVQVPFLQYNRLDPLPKALIATFSQMHALKVRYPSILSTSFRKHPDTNYFYYFNQHDGFKHVGLVVEDAGELRALADECGVADLIYWGTNSDPVYFASVGKIIQLVHVKGYTGAFAKCMVSLPSIKVPLFAFGRFEPKRERVSQNSASRPFAKGRKSNFKNVPLSSPPTEIHCPIRTKNVLRSVISNN
jgi:hypothetical protein